MTGADLLHRRETLGLSREQFAEAIYEHPDQVAEWEGIRGRLPSGLSGRLELALENTKRLTAIRASGIEACPWVEGRLAGATAGDPKDLQRRLADVEAHRASCPLCQTRRQNGAQLLTPGVIISTGTSRVALAPDRATLSMAIDTHAATASQASLANGRRQQLVLDSLRRLGYRPDQARTVSFSVTPRYGPGHPGDPVDYQAHIDLDIAVNDLDRLSATIEGALSAGGTELKRIDFASDSVIAGRARALSEAVSVARNDAALLALAAEGSLGRLLELSTIRPDEDGALRAGPSVPSNVEPAVGPGEVTIEITVFARWEFVPG